MQTIPRLSLRVIPWRQAPLSHRETTGAPVEYNAVVQTAKTGSSLVRECPFASLVLIVGGLVIGGHRTPFSRVHK